MQIHLPVRTGLIAGLSALTVAAVASQIPAPVSDTTGLIPELGECFSSAASVERDFVDNLVEQRQDTVVLLFSMAASYLAGFVGLLLLVIPGLLVAVRFSLQAPLVVLEDKGPIEALNESWERTAGHAFPLLGYWTVVWTMSLSFGLSVGLVYMALVVAFGAAVANHPLVLAMMGVLNSLGVLFPILAAYVAHRHLSSWEELAAVGREEQENDSPDH